MNDEKPKDEEIGALWVRQSERGEWMSGRVLDVDVVCFAIKGGSEKAPQWRVIRSRPRPAQPAAADRPRVYHPRDERDDGPF